jgi:hypothetical protein
MHGFHHGFGFFGAVHLFMKLLFVAIPLALVYFAYKALKGKEMDKKP